MNWSTARKGDQNQCIKHGHTDNYVLAWFYLRKTGGPFQLGCGPASCFLLQTGGCNRQKQVDWVVHERSKSWGGGGHPRAARQKSGMPPWNRY